MGGIEKVKVFGDFTEKFPYQLGRRIANCLTYYLWNWFEESPDNGNWQLGNFEQHFGSLWIMDIRSS